MNSDYISTDSFRGKFPPESYGRNLDEIAGTIQQVIDGLFIDQDGILRGAVNGRSMKPYQNGDVKNRVDGVGTFVERANIPQEVKAVRANYENSVQVSGVYLCGLSAQARATGSLESRKAAQPILNAFIQLWENAAATTYSLGGGGKGWIPKPYGGIHNVVGMHECSVDQYCDITLGLHSYYEVFASETEKRKIEEIVISFADWWYDHDFACVYQGEAIWYKLLPDHSMATSFFLYLFALAASWSPCRKFQDGFETWLDLGGTLRASNDAIWICMNGLPLDCLVRLLALRPDLGDFWRGVGSHQASLVVESAEEKPAMNRLYEVDGLAANYLMAANCIFPNAGYEALAIRCLKRTSERKRFYHLRRDLDLKDIDPRKYGDDCRDMFSCEVHVHWLSAYWKLQEGKGPKQGRTGVDSSEAAAIRGQ